MRDWDKTKEQLIEELVLLRQKIMDCEKLNSENFKYNYCKKQDSINKKYTQNELKQFQVILEVFAEYRIEELRKANAELEEQIAKRNQVEDKLRRERSRLFSVLDGLPALIYLIAPDYTFRFANRLFREHFGSSEGRLCYEVFRGRTSPCDGCITFVPGQPIETHIGEWCYPNGNTYEFYDYPFTDVDGSELLLSFGIDVSERKKAEKAFRLSEERFAKAFNVSPICMSITTLEDGRFIDVNENFCLVLGFTYDEILGRKSLDINFWTDIADREQIVNKLILKQAVREQEIRFFRKDGEARIGLLSAEIINIDGEDQSCWLSILKDITEDKQMEIEMARLDRLNLVGQMAASIGHEIRNPMTTVRGFLQILSEKEGYINDRAFFELMIDELDRANSIITEFLSLARNKMLELKSVNLKSLVNNIYPLVKANAMLQDKQLMMEIIEEIPDMLIDEKEIRQLIHNLVHNALDATPPGGNVIIRLFREDEYVVLSIQDQGSGIDPEIVDKIGTPFFSTKEEGTGLGLAVCYGIADRHHATIDIETGPDGSTFMVIFPVS